MAEDPRAWIHGDETAREALARVLSARPFLLLPPLHRVPLRVGNVVEIAGASNSAKSQVLLQAAVHCILPKEWRGIHFGGLERVVAYFDLDCRFDVLRLSQILRHRIMEHFGKLLYFDLYLLLLQFKSNPIYLVAGSTHHTDWPMNEGCQKNDTKVAWTWEFDEELLSCMRRFLYIRCYSSSDFLAALKTLHGQSERKSDALGSGIYFLMIDSIGAFYWIDRTCQPLPLGDNKSRKNLSPQTLAESIVQEIRKLLELQPMLVLASKTTLFGAGSLTNATQRTSGKWHSVEATDFRTSNWDGRRNLPFHEYMPLVRLFILQELS
uniref:RecA family profile 1 domain-containing protein n=1 Tax=Ananas comosus var. bracteatus TaxID=296719 RepID=A0A6V7PPN7_ANACO|nr:unnamed protein product [Ananas comosus var. bracteatus]